MLVGSMISHHEQAFSGMGPRRTCPQKQVSIGCPGFCGTNCRIAPVEKVIFLPVVNVIVCPVVRFIVRSDVKVMLFWPDGRGSAILSFESVAFFSCISVEEVRGVMKVRDIRTIMINAERTLVFLLIFNFFLLLLFDSRKNDVLFFEERAVLPRNQNIIWRFLSFKAYRTKFYPKNARQSQLLFTFFFPSFLRTITARNTMIAVLINRIGSRNSRSQDRVEPQVTVILWIPLG